MIGTISHDDARVLNGSSEGKRAAGGRIAAGYW